MRQADGTAVITAHEDESGRRHRREPATAVLARLVKPGREAQYPNLARRMVERSKAFPGRLAAAVLHGNDSPDYTVLYSFFDRPALQAWLDSSDRRRLLREADDLAVEHMRLPPLAGLETWFALSHRATLKPPLGRDGARGHRAWPVRGDRDALLAPACVMIATDAATRPACE